MERRRSEAGSTLANRISLKPKASAIEEAGAASSTAENAGLTRCLRNLAGAFDFRSGIRATGSAETRKCAIAFGRTRSGSLEFRAGCGPATPRRMALNP